jgi:hypothetical protein
MYAQAFERSSAEAPKMTLHGRPPGGRDGAFNMKPSIPGVPVSPAMPPRHTAREAIRDGLITAKVKMRLSADPLTDGYDIRVETFKGSVQLSGFVDTAAARAEALELAWDVEGVQLVEDLLDTRKLD